MPLTSLEVELLTVAKFKKGQIDLLLNGVRLERDVGRPIDDLLKDVSVARFRLSKRFLESARKMISARPGMYRDSISRSYYSMYHAARSVTYLQYRGDDYEAHDRLPQGLPNDFPDVASWQNELKNARLKRNEADYEPFPQGEKAFVGPSRVLFRVATDFGNECVKYLRNHGCVL